MKSAVALSKKKDKSVVLSFAVHLSAEELLGARQCSDTPHYVTPESLKEMAEESFDLFLCYLRITLDAADLHNRRGTLPGVDTAIRLNQQRAMVTTSRNASRKKRKKSRRISSDE